MRLVCLSDTHGLHGGLALPPGDVLLHAGDCTNRGTLDEVQAFLTWFAEVGDFRHRVLIAGNHDFAFEHSPREVRRMMPRNVTYLEDSGVNLGGLKFWGSPYTPWFHNWAFNCRGQAIESHWTKIPAEVDVLITHGPPYGVMDRLLDDGTEVGCPFLKRALVRCQPRLHVFGHIHEGYGQVQANDTLFVNAAICDLDYRPFNAPVVIDLHVAHQTHPGRK